VFTTVAIAHHPRPEASNRETSLYVNLARIGAPLIMAGGSPVEYFATVNIDGMLDEAEREKVAFD